MMTQKSSYDDYVTNETMLAKYNAYQQRYAEQIRESDKVLLRMIADIVGRQAGETQPLSLLDIGCSTGNLLFHIKNALPGLELTGGDLAASSIAQCHADARLEGINFETMDMLNIPAEKEYDIIVANAVAVYFDYDEYEQAIQSVARALKPGGWYLAFEWLHPFVQDLKIVETSRSHPDGLKIHFRPFSRVEAILNKHGFTRVDFQPFTIPIDLAQGATYGDNPDGYEDLNSYTVKTESGERLLFRGALYQPWCHMRAQKKAR